MLIILDSHTKRFFSRQYHQGEATRWFHLKDLGDRVFGARQATSYNGQRVLLCQERSASDPTQGVGHSFLIEQSFPVGTKNLFSLSMGGLHLAGAQNVQPNPVTSQQTSLKIFEAGVWRYHFGKETGLGCRMNSLGMCHIRNLRQTTSEQELFSYPAMLDWPQLRGDSLGQRVTAFLALGPRSFHRLLDEEARTPQTKLNRALHFYQKSDEQLCQDILHCNVERRRLAEMMMGIHVTSECEVGGVLHGVQTWIWQMWAETFFCIRLPNGTPAIRHVPDTLLQTRDEILSDLQCRLAPSDEDIDAANRLGNPATDLMRARIWASQFACSPEETSAHEISMRH